MRPLARVARALGDAAPLEDDPLLAGDPRAAYVAWAANVKAFGGTVTAAPHIDGSTFGGAANAAAARYPIAFVFPHLPDTTLNTLFSKLPDDFSNDGRWAYYLAPVAVQQYIAGGGITTVQSVPGEPAPPKPKWYDDLVAALQAGKWLVIGGVALAALSYLPRGRRE